MTERSELSRLFDELIDRAPHERELVLERAGVPPDLRERLRSMIEVEEELVASPATEGSPRRYPWPGDTVGAYRLVAPIGDGGMGSVWLATSRSAPELTAAVKLPAPTGAPGREASARLVQERRVLGALDHPGVVSILDAGETEAGEPYLVLEALRGRPFDVWVRDKRPTLARVAETLRRVGDALDHVHERGFVHRDVKPANVLVSDEGWPVIVDFGAARITERAAVDPSTATRGAAPRTPAFASPEQNRGETATSAADVFGFGSLAHKVLEPSLAELPARRRAAIERALDRARHPDPGQRFRSAGELADALAVALSTGSRARTALAVSIPVAAALAVVAFAAGLLAALALRHGSGARGLDDEVVQGIGRLPAYEQPFDPETLEELAASRGEPDLLAAAAWAWKDDGEIERAHELALRCLPVADGLSPTRRVELAEVLSDLGLPGPILELLASVDPGELDPEAEVDLLLYRALATSRAGGRVDPEELEELTEHWRELELDGPWERELEHEEGEYELFVDDDDVRDRRVFFLRLSLGEREALEAWLEEVDEEAWEEPYEAAGAELEALLLLHLRLLEAGEKGPMDPDLLEEIEEEIAGRVEEGEDGPEDQRAFALARIARAHAEMAHDPGRAARLAREGRDLLEDEGPVHADLDARLAALEEAASKRDRGTDVEGSFELGLGPTVASARRIARAVEDEAEDREDPPWWW